jgi:hypothetical protein
MNDVPSDLPTPWSTEKRNRVQDKMDKQAAEVAKRLKAKCCVVIAFWDDGNYLHILEGGQSPMPLDELYRQRLAAREALQDVNPDAGGVHIN